MKKENLKYKNKLINLTLVCLLFYSQVPVLSQGYQQPIEPEESYDELLQGERGYGQDTQPERGGAGIGTASRPLRGKVVVAPTGSRFDVTLITTLSSGINRVGDIVNATVSTPLTIGSDVVIPSGSQIVGQVVNAIPASRFMAGSGGLLEIRFTAIETPDGHRYPISASVDTTQFSLQASTGGSRLAEGAKKTAIGAGVGAALGTAIGAIAGGMPGRGAWSGAAIGGGAGALTALASKGKELVLQSGIKVPVLLDQSLQVVVPQRN